MRSAVVVALAVAAGCFSYQLRKPDPLPLDAFGLVPSSAGQVCVLRPDLLAFAVTAVVRDNGQLVGATRGRHYFCYLAEPGRHHITSETTDDLQEATLQVVPGRRYYLRQVVDNIVGFVRTRLIWIDETEAQDKITRCEYRILVGVPGKEALPDGTPIASIQ